MPKREDYISWDECFIQMAFLIAQRSKDPNTQAGAVIVDENNIVVGLGYNGWPRGIKDEALPWEREGDFLNTKYAYVVHAEENAIYNSNKTTRGCKMYCTLFPCNECAKTIIQNGIKEIIYYSDKYQHEDVWKASKKMLDLAGVKCTQYSTKFKLLLQDDNKIK
jgi:dCMP deaminase